MDCQLTFRQGFSLVCAILCLCQLASSQDYCNNTWITYPNSNVAGGSYVGNVNLVRKCQDRCLLITGCTGIDFDGANKCWVIKNGGLPMADPTNRTTHYDVKRDMTACTASCTGTSAVTWKETNNTHVAGGTSTTITSFDACLTTCRDDDTCLSFDWDETSTTTKCWLIQNANPTQEANGVKNYYKECFYGGVKVVTPSLIPVDQQQGSLLATGLTSTTQSTINGGGNPNFAKDTVVGDYVSGEVFTIKPAYIVLIGMGLACIILVIIAICVICLYPLRGARQIKSRFSMSKLKSSKNKKVKKESGELHTRRPKALAEDEIGMHTGKTSLHDSTYDHHKLYNEKKNIDSMYRDSKVRDSYNDETKKIRDTYNDINERDSFPDTKTPYHHNNNGTLDRNPLPAYTAHEETHLGNALQRNSLDMDEDRHGAMDLVEDKYRESKNSNFDRIEDKIHDAIDNPTFAKDEDFD